MSANFVCSSDLIIGKPYQTITFADGKTEKIINFIVSKNRTVEISIPEHATVINSSLNISGFVSGWNKSDENPVLDRGANGTWDERRVYYPEVIKDGETYKMWYAGNYKGDWRDRIGYATSNDGLNWSKYAVNCPNYPGDGCVFSVEVPGTWDDKYVYHPAVIKDGTYKMWYSGFDGDHDRIGYATSNDGITWFRYNDNLCTGNMEEDGVGCIFNLGEKNEWDDYYVFGASIIYDEEEKIYKMWYAGCDSSISFCFLKIGYAISTDGIHWMRHKTPVLFPGAPGSWDVYDVYEPAVIKSGGVYEMWYSGFDGYYNRIGYATSTNGINWTKYPDYVLGTGESGEWDSLSVETPAVIKDNGTYKMWYSGQKGLLSYKIGYAENEIGYNILHYPDSISLDAGNNNVTEWNYNGTLNVTKTITAFEGGLNEYLKNCTFDEDGNCITPLTFNSDKGGIKISNIAVGYFLPELRFNESSESNIKPGENLTIKTGIYNAGSELNNIKIKFSVFNITYNETKEIFSENKTINITGNSSGEISFNWTVNYGYYNLTIFIDPDNGVAETDEFNNYAFRLLRTGNLTGDADWDCNVDIVDLMIVAQAFHTGAGDVNYDERADFKKDNFINILDLATAGKNFGNRC